VKLSHEDIDEIEVLMDVAITIFWLSIWGAHLRHLTNTTEPSVCSGDAALCHFLLWPLVYIGISTGRNFKKISGTRK